MAANTCNQPPSFHDGTGAQADYVIGFPYINRADVEVYVGSVDDWTQYTEGNAANANEYQWQNATTIRLNAAAGSDNVRITRETDRCDADTVFTAGASIRAEDLNENMTQNLYITQEIIAALGDLGISVPPGSSGEVDTSTWNDPSYLKWTGEGFEANGVLEAGDAWQDSDDWIPTAAAGDDRWLGIPGGGGTPITAGDGIRIDSPAEINVDLAATTPGLQITGGDLQAIGNSVTQSGGNNDDPNITNGPSNVQITGGANITVVRNSNSQLTISSTAGTPGGATFRGTVDVDDDNTLPATIGGQNPNAVSVSDAFTIENNVAAANVTANWNTVLDNWDTADGIINSGDVILCTTAADAGSPTNARYNLIRTGGNINTLQQVTDAGNTTNNDIVLDDSSLQIQEGADTLTVNWPTGTANRTISFPDASGTVALDVPAVGDGTLTITAGTNISAVVAGGAFTANKATDTTITLNVDDAFVLNTGDTMTGNLQMDGASVIGDNGENVPDADGNWDIQNSNVWQVANGRTIEFPDNTAAPIPGQTGVFVCAGTVAGWTDANGGTWEHPGGTAQGGDANGAVIPFYVQTATRIILGVQTVGS